MPKDFSRALASAPALDELDREKEKEKKNDGDDAEEYVGGFWSLLTFAPLEDDALHLSASDKKRLSEMESLRDSTTLSAWWLPAELNEKDKDNEEPPQEEQGTKETAASRAEREARSDELIRKMTEARLLAHRQDAMRKLQRLPPLPGRRNPTEEEAWVEWEPRLHAWNPARKPHLHRLPPALRKPAGLPPGVVDACVQGIQARMARREKEKGMAEAQKRKAEQAELNKAIDEERRQYEAKRRKQEEEDTADFMRRMEEEKAAMRASHTGRGRPATGPLEKEYTEARAKWEREQRSVAAAAARQRDAFVIRGGRRWPEQWEETAGGVEVRTTRFRGEFEQSMQEID